MMTMMMMIITIIMMMVLLLMMRQGINTNEDVFGANTSAVFRANIVTRVYLALATNATCQTDGPTPV